VVFFVDPDKKLAAICTLNTTVVRPFRPAPAAARSAGPVGSWKRLPLPRSSSAIVLDIVVRSV